MSEKEKSKSHPFAGSLHSTEEILWMSTETYETNALWRLAQSSQGLAVISMIVFSVGILIMIGLSAASPSMLGIVAFVAFALSALPILIIWSIRRFSDPSRLAKVAYAVTNERLLSRSQAGISDLPLEEVGIIRIIWGQGNRDTLSFGPAFDDWVDLVDAVSVKQLIENTRDTRLEDMRS